MPSNTDWMDAKLLDNIECLRWWFKLEGVEDPNTNCTRTSRAFGLRQKTNSLTNTHPTIPQLQGRNWINIGVQAKYRKCWWNHGMGQREPYSKNANIHDSRTHSCRPFQWQGHGIRTVGCTMSMFWRKRTGSGGSAGSMTLEVHDVTRQGHHSPDSGD